MIDGIEIFTKSEIINSNPTIESVFAVAFITGIILTLAAVELYHFEHYTLGKIAGILAAIAVAIVLIDLFLLLFGAYSEKTGKYRYEVKIDDTVTVEELYENYNVTGYDEDNNIFTIEDK